MSCKSVVSKHEGDLLLCNFLTQHLSVFADFAMALCHIVAGQSLSARRFAPGKKTRARETKKQNNLCMSVSQTPCHDRYVIIYLTQHHAVVSC